MESLCDSRSTYSFLLTGLCDGSASANKLNILHSSSILASHYPSRAHSRTPVLLNSIQLVSKGPTPVTRKMV